MGMNVKNIKSESKFVAPPALDAGTYPGAPVQIICLGLQKQDPWKGEEKPPKVMLRVVYELADEFLLDEEGNEIEDKPRWVSEEFTLNSLDSDLAKSTKRYYALDPEVEHKGEFGELTGIPCTITLSKTPSKKDSTVFYNNVSGVSTMRSKDAAKYGGLVNDPVVFDFYTPDLDVFLAQPNWIQERIKEALDFGGSELEALIKGDTSSSSTKEETKEEVKEEESDNEDW